MVEEVRRQFRTIPGIMEGTGKPEYDKCVAISTDASIKKMMWPGAIALCSPLIIGFIFGPEVLGGFLAGATVCGVLMGMFQNNAGGAWDNAKKSFEKGAVINGETYYKGSEPHKASVTGDTVGDPFKDTSGPSMNILIKLMSIVSLVIAPTLAKMHHDKIEDNRKAKMESLVMMNTPIKENSISASGDIKKNEQEPEDPEIKKLVLRLKEDGLINSDNYSVGVKSGHLYLNGKKQNNSVNNKYENFIKDMNDFIYEVKVNRK
ncbi:MAG: sodium/proton-translocating pyrophosphatase, partial [Ginsengibacter sp.]